MSEKKKNSITIPKFYTPKSKHNSHKGSFGKVFAEHRNHFSPEWLTVGYVSLQTPFGQGTAAGFKREQLRRATGKEVLKAIKKNHPFGKNFRKMENEKEDDRVKKEAEKQRKAIRKHFAR